MNEARNNECSESRSDGAGWASGWYWRGHTMYVGIIVGIAVLMNFLVNPFELYPTKLLPPSEISPHAIKTGLLENMEPKAEALIIGSSRVMSVDPDCVTNLTGKPCFNFGLPSAMAEDYYASIRYAREAYGAPIDTVIVGFDLEALHPTLPLHSQGRFYREYAMYFPADEAESNLLIHRLIMLLSLEQTAESVSALKRAIGQGRGRPRFEFRDDGRINMVDPDAKIARGDYNLERKIAKRVRRYPARSLGLSTYIGISPRREKYWEMFLEYCGKNGIDVYVFLTPYHPKFYDVLEPQGVSRLIDEVREFVEETTVNAGGVFRDFSRVEFFDGDPEFFYDEIHPRGENCDKMLRILFGRDGAG